MSSVDGAAGRVARGTWLRVEGVSYSYGDHRVLTDVSLTVGPGRRTGLVGENGSGKSTLLRISAGLLVPTAGSVRVDVEGGGPARVGLLTQESSLDAGRTVGAAVDDAVAPVREAAEAVARAAAAVAGPGADRPAAGAPGGTPDEAARAYDEALAAADRLGAWHLAETTERLLAGLGLAHLPRDRRVGALSGGERARLGLACTLLARPDVLLLDEPTNHLDDAATAHLRDVLAAWPGPVLLASHDRAFLDDVVVDLVDLDPAPVPQEVAGPLVGDGPGSGIGVTRFTGTFSEYVLARLDALDRWERRWAEEEAEAARLAERLERGRTVGHEGRGPRTEARSAAKFYADRNAAVVRRRVGDAERAAKRLEVARVRRPPAWLSFRGLGAAAVPDDRSSAGQTSDGPRPDVPAEWPLLLADRLAVAGRLAPVTLRVDAGDRLLITGANGTGKSTLLAVLAGELDPTAGRLERASGVRVARLAQDEDLPDPHGRGPARTAARAYADLVGEARARAVPPGTFGLLAPRDLARPVPALSAGQRRRLALAALLADPPDVLLLDEPTNQFSLVLVTELEASIPRYPGAVVVATHDRWLRRSWQGRRLHLDG